MRRPFLAVLAFLTAGCASTNPGTPVPPEQVAVHESVASVKAPYQAIKRVHVDSWMSNVYLPTYASRDEALQAFRQHAVALGGNGVINFGCYRRGEAQDAPLNCNGTVVRFQ